MNVIKKEEEMRLKYTNNNILLNQVLTELQVIKKELELIKNELLKNDNDYIKIKNDKRTPSIYNW
tara:strand:- start:1215 stop:1409 length:195 start_codon:yes stop_codon:yes gene_type:complete